MRLLRVMLTLVLALTIIDCAGTKKMKAPAGGKLTMPEWYVKPPTNDKYLFGVATATSLDLQTAVDKARQDGRVEIARQMDIRMAGMSKRFIEETGLDDDAELLGMFTQVSSTVVSDSLTGSRLAKQQMDRDGGGFRAYVMMEMPIGEANARFMEKIRSQQRLYTRFRASEAFEDLDRMVDEYEQWKKEQASGADR